MDPDIQIRLIAWSQLINSLSRFDDLKLILKSALVINKMSLATIYLFIAK